MNTKQLADLLSNGTFSNIRVISLIDWPKVASVKEYKTSGAEFNNGSFVRYYKMSSDALYGIINTYSPDIIEATRKGEPVVFQRSEDQWKETTYTEIELSLEEVEDLEDQYGEEQNELKG